MQESIAVHIDVVDCQRDESSGSQPILDLPTAHYTEGGQEKVQHLVGDTLEIQMFQQSGWR